MLDRQELVFACLLGLIILVLIRQATARSTCLPSFPLSSPLPSPIPAMEVEEQLEWPPEFSNRTIYNENEIVEILTDLYTQLIKLCYISDRDIIWPPPEGQPIDEATCEELHLEPTVISLMRRLPYPKLERITRIEFIPSNETYCYVVANEIREGRDTLGDPVKGPNVKYILPQDIMLARGRRDSDCIVLDTRENTVRVMSIYHGSDGHTETPDDPEHYRNLPAAHAPTFLRRYLDNIKSLYSIPCGEANGSDDYITAFTDPEVHSKIKRLLIETYGWPDNFQCETWKEDMEAAWTYARHR